MLKTSYLALLMFILSHSLCAKTDTTIVHGIDKNYANKIIEVYVEDDFISRKKIIVAYDTVDNKGNFKLTIPIKQTQLLQIPLGIYNGLIYAEPNKTYKVSLPNKQDKTFADSLNPYFQPTDFYLKINNKNVTDLNRLVLEFDNIYRQYIEKYYYNIKFKPIKDTIEQGIKIIENIFKDTDNSYFKNYMKYKFAELRYISYKRNSMYITNEYFNEMPVLYKNVGYSDFFNKLFSNYLKFYSQKAEGERLYSDIALAKSPYLAKQTFANNIVLTKDSVQELVLLKGINDAFGYNDFPKKSMLLVLDSIICCSKINENKKIALNIKQKQEKTIIGNKAPNFELMNNRGTLRKLSDYLANYVYLNFCSVNSFACQQDFEFLKKLYDKHKTEFKIVSVTIDADFEKAKEYFKQKGYEWTLLNANTNNDVLNKYKIKAYPTYFLIDPQGVLIMSPAQAPTENFEWYFFNHLRNVKYQKLRNNKK